MTLAQKTEVIALLKFIPKISIKEIALEVGVSEWSVAKFMRKA